VYAYQQRHCHVCTFANVLGKLSDRTELTKRSFIVSLMKVSSMIHTRLMKKFGNGKIFIIIADPMQHSMAKHLMSDSGKKFGLCVKMIYFSLSTS